MSSEAKAVLFHSIARRMPGIGGFHKRLTTSEFKTFFGVTPFICEKIFDILTRATIYPTAKPKELLYSLHFLKTYGRERVCSKALGVNVRTYRDKIWRVIDALSILPMVQFCLRKRNARTFPPVSMSIDGVDCDIQEPSPFSRSWFSFKSNGPGVRYEVGIGPYSGLCVWVNGPFRPGANPDINLFQVELKQALGRREVVLADNGYKDARCVQLLTMFPLTYPRSCEQCTKRLMVD